MQSLKNHPIHMAFVEQRISSQAHRLLEMGFEDGLNTYPTPEIMMIMKMMPDHIAGRIARCMLKERADEIEKDDIAKTVFSHYSKFGES